MSRGQRRPLLLISFLFFALFFSLFLVHINNVDGTNESILSRLSSFIDSELEWLKRAVTDEAKPRVHGAVIADQDDGPGQGFTCAPGRPCSNGACCGKSGYCGYGPAYCGTGCNSNCDAKAECGKYAAEGHGTCPLNVCCSKWGFCGTTPAFCQNDCQSNCGQPTEPIYNSDVQKHVTGYWESWRAKGDICGDMAPNQIPIDALNGVNFAFAYIEPKTYNIVPMPGTEATLFAQVADAKVRNPNAQVFVSIGGWAFSDNQTSTQPLFSEIADNVLYISRFSNNLVKFMMHYGFDGVDIDWEYPGAPDRGGKAKDVSNFVNMLLFMRVTFNSFSQGMGISITVPTSYWYLRWFDVRKLAHVVDYFNLMSYDLHGTWDSTDPIGPYVYAHTNLTEIDLALRLFWRNDIPPSKINLGLAFYGRSFQLKDPSCYKPGCPFHGPAPAGPCSLTQGIMTYREIMQLKNDNTIGKEEFYDKEAGVKYLVYGEKGQPGNLWVSYDDSETWQQKIALANKRGLRGLFIWAIDQDDSSLNALKAITGKDILPSPTESNTFSDWNLNDCVITQCGATCPLGMSRLTGLNEDRTGKGCPKGGSNSRQRSFCCPPWGMPDPSECYWKGSAPECYGQCRPGEVVVATDNYGGSGHCNHGKKVYCCPATSGEAAIGACKTLGGRSCPKSLPQQVGWVPGLFLPKVVCCPAHPKFDNCAWHGKVFTCDNNRCPVGQVEITRHNYGDSFVNCVLGRERALCCDAPFDGSAFLPVPLDHLFEVDFDDVPEFKPVFDEAFDLAPNESPHLPLYLNDNPDPNAEPFAWTVLVGLPEDVTSMRKRDGSQLLAFDCPNPHKDDFSTQTFKAVCMAESDDNNCEEITLGGVRGTIVRLPEDCGPDEWVRAVSFEKLGNRPLPSHLSKRAPTNASVYEVRYDYNFRLLRRNAAEIFIRMDTSDHPGYWDSVIKSPIESKRDANANPDWRRDEMSWFEQHGYVDGEIGKRGIGDDGWWEQKFQTLLHENRNYGLHKSWNFDQVLYDARKTCHSQPDAYVQAKVFGHFSSRFDFGFSFIGSYTNKNAWAFPWVYGYFSMTDTVVEITSRVEGHAGFQIKSKQVPLTNNILNPLGALFNIKGFPAIGPFVTLDGQLESLVSLSGYTQSSVKMTSEAGLTWMFPPNLTPLPDENVINFFYEPGRTQAGYKMDMNVAGGSVTTRLIATLGFRAEAEFFGQSVLHKHIGASFEGSLTGKMEKTLDCPGVKIGGDYGAAVYLTARNQDNSSDWRYDVLPGRTWLGHNPICYDWSGGTGSTETEMESLSASNASVLSPRADLPLVLFPDGSGISISCPDSYNSPTGNCHTHWMDDYLTYDDNSAQAAVKRDQGVEAPSTLDISSTLDDSEVSSADFGGHIFKRGSKGGFEFCNSEGLGILTQGFTYPSTGPLIKHKAKWPFDTWGPTNPSDCDDYSFGTMSTPTKSTMTFGNEKIAWDTEHVLEWQLLEKFWTSMLQNPAAAGFSRPNAASAKYNLKPELQESDWGFCQYMYFWWQSQVIDDGNGFKMAPTYLLMRTWPQSSVYRDELPLFEREANSIKGAFFNTYNPISDKTMDNYLNAGSISKAINKVKSAMFVIKYLQQQPIQVLYLQHSQRVADTFDEIEEKLMRIDNANINKRKYRSLDLSDFWKRWMYWYFDETDIKMRAFVEKNVNKIRINQQGQQNQAIINRVRAMETAWQALRGVSTNNPLPVAWKSIVPQIPDW